VVLSFTQGPMIERLQKMGVGSEVIYTEKPFDLTKWGKVKEFLKEKKVDLIHAHGTRAASNVLWAARSLKIPVVYTIHGWSFHPDQRPLLKRMRIAGESYITNRTAVNISVSEANQASGKENIKGFESVLVNYGIDQKKFSPAGVTKNVRAELNIAPDALLVLFIARFTKQKQPLAMIRAFKAALESVPEMRLLMVGDGELREEALRLSSELELGDRVLFQTFRQDVPDVLAAADIFVLPSLWEGLPIGLLEAMAMGKAIIASDVDGTGEVLKHRENGLLIKTNPLVSSLTEALIQLGRDREMQKKFQEKAIETISGRFNVTRMAREIEAIYNDVLNKPLA